MASRFVPMDNISPTKLFDVERRDNITILHLAPHPFTQRYESIHHEYNVVMKQMEDLSPPYLVFDFSDCRYIDSIMVGTMAQLTRRARTLNGNAVLVHVSNQIEEMLRSLMMLESRKAAWQKYPSLEDAIADLPW
ncbi:MAG: STAS domain-containing protein [Rubinisphaera brasiliensis]|uniref:STAS domain-containing protein n=1 Tax=Rubinisphaera brasiliensis TaxID=119 RepID=UPI00391C46AF